MANLSTVTNAAFDALAAAVPAPFGPLTRVGTLQATNRIVPNSREPIEVYGAGGTNDIHFFVSYEDLSDTATTQTKLREAYGHRYKYYDAENFIEALWLSILAPAGTRVDPLTVTEENYATLARTFQYYKDFRELPPVFDWYETKKANRNKVSFTTAVTSAAVRTITNTSTGYHYERFIVDWGDAISTSIQDLAGNFTTAAHTYTVDGTYNIRLFGIGRGGIPEPFIDSEIVNVP